MTKLMLEAIEALRQLPAEQQDEIAGAVFRLARHDSGVYQLTPAERGEFATDDEIKAIWAKHGRSSSPKRRRASSTRSSVT